MMDDQRDPVSIAAPCDPAYFAQRFRHMRIGVQVVDSEVTEWIEHDNVCIDPRNGISNTLAVHRIEREKAVFISFQGVKKDPGSNCVPVLRRKCRQHSLKVGLKSAA